MKQGKIGIIALFALIALVILATIIFVGVNDAQNKANRVICDDRCKEHKQVYLSHTNHILKNNICYCDNDGKTEDYMI